MSFIDGYLQKCAVIGIPDRGEYGDLDRLRAGDILTLVRQLHLAKRSGRHYDVRLGQPSTGLFSWATKKDWPAPGERRAVYRQPLHSWAYKDYEGEIVPGYGHGTVSKDYEGRILITNITPQTISFTRISERYPQRFTLVRPQDPESKTWLLLNQTPTRPLGYEKPSYKVLKADDIPDRLRTLEPGASVQAKVDGAHAVIDLMNNTVDIASHRTSDVTGGPILHTERIFAGRPHLEIPEELRNTRVMGEIYGERDARAIPVQELSGILNSSTENALKKLQESRTRLKVMLFNSLDPDVPYADRRRKLEQIQALLPEVFTLPEEARTPEEAQSLLKRIQSGEHPLTTEGIVIHPPTGIPEKYPLRKEHDVYIRNIIPEPKHPELAGAFTYSWEPGGEEVGNVGTGFDVATRRRMMQTPDDFIGRRARVAALERLPSGALRAPSFVTVHEDY